MNLRLTVAVLLFALVLSAERLPVRVFTSADGLLEDGSVLDILEDSSGFLWFVTGSGLSRFDGRAFQTYSSAEGFLGLNSIAEVSPSDYWISGRMGLAHYRPGAPSGKRFPLVVFDPNHAGDEVNQVAGDGQGGLWVATGDGLYHGTPSAHGLEFRLVVRPTWEAGQAGGFTPITRVFRDSEGVVWATAFHSIYRISSGQIDSFAGREGIPRWAGSAFLEDRRGQLWLGTPFGLLLLDRHAPAGHKLVLRTIETQFGLPENSIYRLCETADGHLWAASSAGLLEWDGSHLRRYTSANGLSDGRFFSVGTDSAGNLWAGTAGAGVNRVRRGGFVSLDASDGVPQVEVRGFYSSPSGGLVSVSDPFRITLHDLSVRKPGALLRTIRPGTSGGLRAAWGLGQVALVDARRETWIATGQGLARFAPADSLAALDGRAPLRLYTVRDGLPGTVVRSVFEDSHKDIWIGSVDDPAGGLARWLRASDRIEDLSHAPGVLAGRAPAAFAETREGSIWIALHKGLMRYRSGVFQSFLSGEKNLPGDILSLFVDAKGRLWGAGRVGGLFRVEDADSAEPRFTVYGRLKGLAADDAICVTGDAQGNVYAGTPSGVDRLDPASGRIRHFTTADGLAGNVVLTCSSDAAGNLWFGTSRGLSLLRSGSDEAPLRDIRITGIQLANRAVPISDLGETALTGPTLGAGENHLQISFTVPGGGGSVRYQYQLEGADTDWSSPTADRTVSFANLAPGDYRFLVKAVSSGAPAEPHAASFSFTILPPVWARWWFLTLAATALCAIAYTAYRFRLDQLLRVERVRMRIATDLHDDIGSALSQISLMTEVANRQAGDQRAASLDRVASIAREATRSISDIVWSINPQRDSLGDLSVRIRSFATELCSARNIECTLELPEADEGIPLEIDTRRQLLLIAKEAVHNLVKHAQCSEAALELRCEGKWLILRIADNGKGFDAQNGHRGHGVESMRSRAAALGGTMALDSRPGATRIEFRVPV
jgi:ligand-binding sensor domain-containing protein/two-component sensor histidine kinase